MDYVLQTNNLTKKYRRFPALNELTMHVPKGSIYGLVGKNGAGKTTLIRVVCGLQEPTSGSFTLYQQENNSRSIANARRRIGAVVETPSIFLNMTAEDNLKQHVSNLRKKLQDADGIEHIETVWGIGFKLAEPKP